MCTLLCFPYHVHQKCLLLWRETRKETTHRLLLLVVTNGFEFSVREYYSWDGLQDFLGSRFNERSRFNEAAM
jgi:hypothetical protein